MMTDNVHSLTETQRQRFSPLGLCLLLFLFAYFLFPTRDTMIGGHSVEQWLDGTATSQLEKQIIENSTFLSYMAEGYRNTRFSVFGEGSKGVMIGQDGWLFSSEEFITDTQYADRLLLQNTTEIAQMVQELQSLGINVVIALLPDKVRVLEEKIPTIERSMHVKGRYDSVRKDLLKSGIYVPDLRPAMLRDRDRMFFKTDTHWTPLGSRRAASLVAREISWYYPHLTQLAGYREYGFIQRKHEGDLAKFVPKSVLDGLHYGQEYYTKADIRRLASSDFSADLFADRTSEIALVGTSFSADEKWGFVDFLRLRLQSDIDNLALKGQGVLQPMQDLLAQNYFVENTPKLLIWEIPERYLSRRDGK